MIIECTVAKTYEIDDDSLKEYVDFVLQTGIEPDFYQFIDDFLTTNDYEKFNEIYEKTTTKMVDDKQDNIGILENMLKRQKCLSQQLKRL